MYLQLHTAPTFTSPKCPTSTATTTTQRLAHPWKASIPFCSIVSLWTTSVAPTKPTTSRKPSRWNSNRLPWSTCGTITTMRGNPTQWRIVGIKWSRLVVLWPNSLDVCRGHGIGDIFGATRVPGAGVTTRTRCRLWVDCVCWAVCRLSPCIWVFFWHRCRVSE